MLYPPWKSIGKTRYLYTILVARPAVNRLEAKTYQRIETYFTIYVYSYFNHDRFTANSIAIEARTDFSVVIQNRVHFRIAGGRFYPIGT